MDKLERLMPNIGSYIYVRMLDKWSFAKPKRMRMYLYCERQEDGIKENIIDGTEAPRNILRAFKRFKNH